MALAVFGSGLASIAIDWTQRVSPARLLSSAHAQDECYWVTVVHPACARCAKAMTGRRKADVDVLSLLSCIRVGR
jgi:hypothetical protein